MSFSIVIPAYNESKSIGTVLAKVCELYSEAEIIVVDDCSTDHTVQIVEGFPQVRIIRQPENMGPTNALATGFRSASHDVIVALDADGQHPAESIGVIAAPILDGEADLVLGARASLPRLGEKLIARFAGVRDATTGFKALRKKCIPLMEKDIAYGGMLIVRARRKGYRVKEVPIEVQERIGGQSFHSDYVIFRCAFQFLWWRLRG